MNLYINKNELRIDNTFEIKDANGVTLYYCMPDFSYKKRLHLIDNKDNKIAYIQYKILTSQNGVSYFDSDDNMKDFSFFDIAKKDDYLCVCTKSNNIIFNVFEDDDKIVIDIKDDINVVDCVLFFLGNLLI